MKGYKIQSSCSSCSPWKLRGVIVHTLPLVVCLIHTPHLQATMADLPRPSIDHLCPKCRQSFSSSRAILAHLNNNFSPCNGFLDNYDANLAFAEEATQRHAELGEHAFQNCVPPPPSISKEPAPSTFVEYHPGSSFVFGQGANTFERVQENDFAHLRKANPYYPFKGREEWDLASFLARSSLSQAEIDEFLKLDWVIRSFMSPCLVTLRDLV